VELKANRRITAGLLCAGALLAAATPAFLVARDGALRVYLIHPALFVMQVAPYLLAALLWLPCRSLPELAFGRVLAWMLLSVACVIYGSMLTGVVHPGGDMVAVLFGGIDAVTGLAVLVFSAIAHGVLYWHRRRHRERTRTIADR
jgi:hypothetical protein